MSLAIATKIASKLEGLGYDATIRESRRSTSCYVSVERIAEEIDEMRDLTIRVGNHTNPARRFWRVSGSDDRAIACETEVRTDISRAWLWAIDAAVDALEGRVAIDPLRPRQSRAA